MKILLTGAFGRLGSQVAEEILRRGHELRCFDLETQTTRKAARPFEGRCEIRFGNLATIEDFSDLIAGTDGIIHLAALLPPATELQPGLAEKVNVQATRKLIEAIGHASQPPQLVYPSSVSVFARTDDRPRPRRVDDPVEATDNYTRHKLLIEAELVEQDFPWTILRVGVAVDSRTLSADRDTFRSLLQTAADSPVEWVHPKDVALAMCRCLEVPESRGKILLIGGGPDCQVSQAHFMGTALRALGLKYPEHIHGDAYFYMHWMDSSEAQALLQFQRQDFADYEQEMARRLRLLNRLIFPFRWLANPLLAHAFKRL